MLQKISVTFDHSNASLQNKSIQFFKIKDSVYNKMNNKDCFTPHPKGYMSVCFFSLTWGDEDNVDAKYCVCKPCI